MNDTEQVSTPTPIGPATAGERIRVIDALRGLALFGILAANMRGFAIPASVYFNTLPLWPSGLDFQVQFAIETFVMGKFITLFAFLFGLGFAAQFDRAESRGTRFSSIYVRRLLILLFFGLLHQLLLWWGDILVAYALVGFALLLFRRTSIKRLIIWGTVFYWLPMLIMLAGVVASMSGVQMPMPPTPTRESIDAAIRIYREGTLAEIVRLRMEELSHSYKFLPFYGWRVLALFLFGAAAWRSRLLHDPAAIAPLVRRFLIPLLLIGVTGNLIPVSGFMLFGVDPMKPSLAGWWLQLVQSIGVPALSAFYASLVMLAYTTIDWRARLESFVAVGRMALTNYLMQSLICTTIFYSYGFAQFGKYGPAVLLIPTLLVYGMQILFSAWWLGRHRFGPMEWLWRTLTYGRLPAS
jgi:uncharacterized protein